METLEQLYILFLYGFIFGVLAGAWIAYGLSHLSLLKPGKPSPAPAEADTPSTLESEPADPAIGWQLLETPAPARYQRQDG